ncbi:MAG: hypothetical protein HYS33_02390 [Acidobacteria bacterium]|nr:hypothetical protein [Acidobacteriota bacterium]
MVKSQQETWAAIGLRVKSGRAIAVVLRGPAESPLVVWRERLRLADPGKPKTWQPFHAVIDLPWKEAVAATREAAREAQVAAAHALRELQKRLRDAGLELQSAGIVAGGTLDPAQIANPHIRAHAAEGRFFREAAERGAEACGLAWRTFAQKSLYAMAATEIGCTVESLKSRVTALGTTRIKPWRADEKEAALAAWVVLAGRTRR